MRKVAQKVVNSREGKNEIMPLKVLAKTEEPHSGEEVFNTDRYIYT